MSAPRPCVADPFHPLGSISNIKSLLYTYISKCNDYFLQVVRRSVSWYGRHLTIRHVLFENAEPNVENDYSSYFDFQTVSAAAY